MATGCRHQTVSPSLALSLSLSLSYLLLSFPGIDSILYRFLRKHGWRILILKMWLWLLLLLHGWLIHGITSTTVIGRRRSRVWIRRLGWWCLGTTTCRCQPLKSVGRGRGGRGCGSGSPRLGPFRYFWCRQCYSLSQRMTIATNKNKRQQKHGRPRTKPKIHHFWFRTLSMIENSPSAVCQTDHVSLS